MSGRCSGLSGMSIGALYISLLVLLIAGITAAIMHGFFGQLWPWAAIVLVVVIVVAMYAVASRYYATIRRAVGLPSMNDKKGEVHRRAGLRRRSWRAARHAPA